MKDYEEHLLMKIVQHFYWFFTLNLLFSVANLLFIFAILLLQVHVHNSIIFFISLLPFGASLSAMLSCLNKMTLENDISVVKDYFYYYKKSFFKSSAIWGVASTILFVMVMNIFFLMNTEYFSLGTPPYLILIILVISICLCGLNFVSKFDNGLKDVLKLSFYFSIRKGYLAILNVLIFLFWLFILFVKPLLGLGVLPSLFLWLVEKNTEFILK